MADLIIKIKGDSVSVEKALKKTNAALKKTENQTKKTSLSANPGLKGAYMAVAAVMTGVVAQAFKKVIMLASDLEEANAKFGTVFRNNSIQANEMRKELVESYGLSAKAATEFLGTVQDFLVPMGFARKAATGMSGELVILARDLASFNQGMGITTEQALKDLTGAITGIKIPMKKYGVDINEAALKNFALEQGIKKSLKAMTTQEKATLILQKTIADTSDAQGDYIRTQDSLANSFKTIAAWGQDVATVIGQEINGAIQPTVVGFKKWIRTAEGLEATNKFLKGMFFYLTLVKEIIGTIVRPFIFFGKAAWTAIFKVVKAILVLKDTIMNFANDNKAAFKEGVIDRFNDVVDAIKNGVTQIQVYFKIFKELVIELASPFLKVIKLITDGFRVIGEFIQEHFGDKLEAVMEKVNKVGTFFSNLKNKIVSNVTGASNSISETLLPVLTKVGSKAQEGFEAMSLYWEENKDILTNGFKSVQERYQEMMNAQGAATIDGMDIIVNDNQSAADDIKRIWDKQQKEMAIAAKKAWEERTKSVKQYLALFNSIASDLVGIEKNKLDSMDSADTEAKNKQAKKIIKMMHFEKAASIASAIIDTAAAVVKSLPNIPLSVLVGAAGAVSIAKIISTPIPSVADLAAPHGADFVTDGKETITVGDNPSGKERVKISPEEDEEGGAKNVFYIENLIVNAENPEQFGNQMKEFGIRTAKRA
jgi:hypothetical protein